MAADGGGFEDPTAQAVYTLLHQAGLSEDAIYDMAEEQMAKPSVEAALAAGPVCIGRSPLGARGDSYGPRYVDEALVGPFEQYGYTLDLEFLDGREVTEETFERTGHPEAFTVALRSPAGTTKEMVFRYPSWRPYQERAYNLHPTNLIAAMNTELLADTPLELFRLLGCSDALTYALIDTSRFDDDLPDLQLGGAVIFERVDSPLQRGFIETSLVHEVTYDIALSDAAVTWPSIAAVDSHSSTEPVDLTDGLTGCNVAFTGEFQSTSQGRISGRLLEVGASVSVGLSERTDLLVVGTDPEPLVWQAMQEDIPLLSEGECRHLCRLTGSRGVQ